MLKKIFLYFLLVITLAILGFGAWLYLNREDLEKALIKSINEQLIVPVEIENSRIDPFSKFPLIALSLENVKTSGSGSFDSYPLLELKTLSFGVEIMDLIRGDLIISHLFLENGQVNLIIPSNGMSNLKLFKTVPQESSEKDSIQGIEIKDIQFLDMDLRYLVPDKDIRVEVWAKNFNADLLSSGSIFQAGVNLIGTTNAVSVKGVNYAKEKNILLKGLLTIDLEKQFFSTKDLNLDLEGVKVKNDLMINWKEATFVDLISKVESSPISEINKHIPDAIAEIVSRLNLKGKTEGKFLIKGEISEKSNPAAEILVPMKNVELAYFDSLSSNPIIETGNFRYYSPDFFNTGKDRLEIKEVELEWENEKVTGELILPNIQEDSARVKIAGTVKLRSILEMSKIKALIKPEGSIDLDLSYAGEIFKQEYGLEEKFSVRGSTELKGLKFEIDKRDLEAEIYSGKIEFNKQVLAISDLKTRFGHSDIEFDGFVLNFINFMFLENQPIQLETKITSEHLFLQELLANESDSEQFVMDLNPLATTLINAQIDHLHFNRFYASDISGRVKMKDSKIMARDVSMDMSDGKLKLDLEIDASDSTSYSWIADFALEDLLLDSTFWYFKDFGQSFLRSEHLEGRLSASGGLVLESDKYLNYDLATLSSTVDASVKNGALVNFEPAQNFRKYVGNKAELDHIVFDELTNNFLIKDERLMIPKMDIRTNVRNASIYGFHQFNNDFEYHLQLPVLLKNKKDKDERFGIVEQASGVSSILLKIEGNPSDYNIDYDTELLLSKVKKGLFMETREAFDLFRRKKKEKQVELEDDEYFEIGQ